MIELNYSGNIMIYILKYESYYAEYSERNVNYIDHSY